MKLSVILPVYNVEKYIHKCVESLYAQCLNENDFEIIVVNDGTPDNSIEKLKYFEQDHANIIILNQENRGVSIARNNGLKMAKGQYVLFIDPDDLLIPDSLPLLLSKAIENELDILVGGYLRMDEKKTDIISTKEIFCNSEEKIMEGIDYFIDCYNQNEGFVWRNLYRRDFLDRNNILFSSQVSFMEDSLFVITALTNAKRVSFSPISFYIYVQHENSAMATMNVSKLYSLNTVISELWKFRKKNISNEYTDKVCDCLFSSFSVLLWYLSHYNLLINSRHNVLADLKNKCPDLSFSNNFRQRVISFCYKFCPSIYLLFRYWTARVKY